MPRTWIEPITSLEDPIDDSDHEPFQARVTVFKLIILVLFAILLRQLWVLQIARGDEYRQHADNNRFRVMAIEPTRGIFYDRTGISLARNTPSYTISILPADLPKQADAVYGKLSVMLGMPPGKIRELAETPPDGTRKTDIFTPVPIKGNVSSDIAFMAEERHLELPGVLVQTQPVRDYLDGSITALVLGFMGAITSDEYEESKEDAAKGYSMNDRIGRTGLEALYEDELRGLPGERDVEVDSTGREVNTLFVKNPVPGHNLKLTIDIGLQRAITQITENWKAKEQFNGIIAAVAMDPRNGQVLAMVSLPAYDNNLFSKSITDEQLAAIMGDPKKPMINHAISDVAAPGSTFKIVTAAAALQEGVVTPNTKINDPGYILIPNPNGGAPAVMHNWTAQGWQDMIAALANSNDTYFYTLAGGPANGEWPGVGPSRLAKYARLFGFAAKTRIDLPGEEAGIIPDEDWKKAMLNEPWYRGDTYNMGIGQGFVATTPLQVAVATVALANGGVVYKPQIVMETTDSEGKVVKAFKPEVIREIPVDNSYLEIIKDGLRAGMLVGKTSNGIAYIGTSYDSEVRGANVAGKTGTAEYGIPDEHGNSATHGWFTLLAPREDPQIVLTVYMEKGSGRFAANLSAEIMRYYFHLPEKKN